MRLTQKNITRDFSSKLKVYSTPRTAQHKAYKYLGKTAKLYPSNNPVKKYTIFDPNNNKWVNFGYSFKQFSLGVTIDKYHMNADFVFFWVGVEW